jgi:hypothetical protein
MVESLMTRRSLTTHIPAESQLSEDFDRYKEMHGLDNNSSALQKLVADGVRPYRTFQIYLNVLGWSWAAMLTIAAGGYLMAWWTQSPFWAGIASNALAGLILASGLVIGGGGYMIKLRARYTNTGVGSQIIQVFRRGESA